MVRNLSANAGDTGSVSGLGRSPGEGNGSSLQYSCLENAMDRSLAGHSLLKSRTRLSTTQWRLVSLAVPGLHRCEPAFCGRGEQGLLLITVHGLLVVMDPLVEHRL